MSGGRKRKGFSLVELLIVIIIIGMLASVMMLLMGTAEDKAQATAILSDIRSMKAAVIVHKLEKGQWPEIPGEDDEAIKKMFGGGSLENFKFISSGDEYAHIEYDLSHKSSGVRRKLALIGDSTGLLGEEPLPGTDPASYNEEEKVWMKVH